jgi:serine/threonine protein kinase
MKLFERNIFVKRLGGVKIGDLGLCKSVEGLTQNSSRFPGTSSYMSPEVVSEEKDYTSKIDVWALGCVLYELLTLERLFDAKNDFKIKEKILYGEIKLPVDGVEPKLKEILKGYI